MCQKLWVAGTKRQPSRSRIGGRFKRCLGRQPKQKCQQQHSAEVQLPSSMRSKRHKHWCPCSWSKDGVDEERSLFYLQGGRAFVLGLPKQEEKKKNQGKKRKRSGKERSWPLMSRPRCWKFQQRRKLPSMKMHRIRVFNMKGYINVYPFCQSLREWSIKILCLFVWRSVSKQHCWNLSLLDSGAGSEFIN